MLKEGCFVAISKEEAISILRKEISRVGEKHNHIHDDTIEKTQAEMRALTTGIGVCSDCPEVNISKKMQDNRPRVELRCRKGCSPIKIHELDTTPLGQQPRCGMKA